MKTTGIFFHGKKAIRGTGNSQTWPMNLWSAAGGSSAGGGMAGHEGESNVRSRTPPGTCGAGWKSLMEYLHSHPPCLGEFLINLTRRGSLIGRKKKIHFFEGRFVCRDSPVREGKKVCVGRLRETFSLVGISLSHLLSRPPPLPPPSWGSCSLPMGRRSIRTRPRQRSRGGHYVISVVV